MISTETVSEIAAKINESPLVDDEVVNSLRQQYKDIHFTYCMEDDIPNNQPILEEKAFNLYLIDGREHCLCLTSNHEVATGIVVAEIIEDED